MSTNDGKYRVRSVERALSILETLRDDCDIRPIDVSRQTMIPKGMTFKLLDTLCSAGYVYRDPETNRYRLGMALFELGVAAGDQVRKRLGAHDVLRLLVSNTNETAHLAVLQDSDVLYVDKVDSNASLRMVTAIGIRRPAYCTGTGKALLAGLSDEDVGLLMAGKRMPRFTPNTICTIDDLLSELAMVRARGYAVDNEENEPGIICIGAPVCNREGAVISAISVSGPTVRISRERIPKLAKSVMEAASRISDTLG